MALDISTMSMMVSASLILQSITLIYFFFLANKYPGVGIYAVGTLFSAIGFLIIPICPFVSDKFIEFSLKFLSNLLLISSQIIYTIGIIRFLNKKVNSFFFIALTFASFVIQFYSIYIKNDFIIRNMGIIFAAITAYFWAIYFLIKFRERYLYASSIFICISFVFNIIFLLFRAIMIPLTNTKALLDSNVVNLTTFWSMFLFDYLRNAGFIMMICQRLYHEIHQLATLDFLTNTFNRREMQQCLEQEIAKFNQSKTPFSLIMLDVDRFKLINDTYGHDRGDLVLQHLTTILKQNLRSEDILSRWGGEEFLILLPNTDIQESFLMANKLRTTVEENPANNRLIYYTISLGVGTFNQEYTGELDSLLIAIDQALYQAKENGRNQVVIAKNP
jgi:diguanylate cyclase (GGDEF)-like protein